MAQQGDKITDRTLAAGILKRIIDRRALLTVTLPGISTVYNSSILEINSEQGYLLLDELNPKEGHEKLLELKKLSAMASVKGVEMRFTTTLEKVGKESGISLYRVGFPDIVWHHQKRQNFRITIEPGLHIPIKFKLKNGQLVRARLIDISETGIRALMETPVELEIGAEIPICEVALPDGTNISSKFELRFNKFNKKDNTLIIGGRFINLPRANQRELSRKVSAMQRDMMKRLPKDQL